VHEHGPEHLWTLHVNVYTRSQGGLARVGTLSAHYDLIVELAKQSALFSLPDSDSEPNTPRHSPSDSTFSVSSNPLFAAPMEHRASSSSVDKLQAMQYQGAAGVPCLQWVNQARAVVGYYSHVLYSMLSLHGKTSVSAV
jgi:hypothetical protein